LLLLALLIVDDAPAPSQRSGNHSADLGRARRRSFVAQSWCGWCSLEKRNHWPMPTRASRELCGLGYEVGYDAVPQLDIRAFRGVVLPGVLSTVLFAFLASFAP
jgi:hypothetical protein